MTDKNYLIPPRWTITTTTTTTTTTINTTTTTTTTLTTTINTNTTVGILIHRLYMTQWWLSYLVWAAENGDVWNKKNK